MTLIASSTGYIEFFRPSQAEGNFQNEQTIVMKLQTFKDNLVGIREDHVV